MFDIIKFYYKELHIYTLDDVKTFLLAGLITQEQFDEITGE